jgi:hypothetical protein
MSPLVVSLPLLPVLSLVEGSKDRRACPELDEGSTIPLPARKGDGRKCY